MRTLVVVSLAASILLGAASANASSWRDLRIDASSDSRFTDSIQQMRDELPYHKALLFVIVLKDLKTHLAPADYRQRLDGLTFKQIAHLASPQATAEYLAHYSGGGSGLGFSGWDGTAAAGPAFSGGSWSGSTVGVGVTWGQ
jgi:hypothetical protein